MRIRPTRQSACLAAAVIFASLQPAWSQSDNSLPPAAQIMSVLHRSPDGSIVGEDPAVPATPPPQSDSPQAAAMPSGAVQKSPPAAARPALPPEPAPAKSTALLTAPASGPDAWDEISCKIIVWQPEIRPEACLQALKAARARVLATRRSGAKPEAEPGG